MSFDIRYIEKIHTVEDVSKTLKVSPETIRKLCRTGQLKAYKKLRKWFILESDLIDWIKKDLS